MCYYEYKLHFQAADANEANDYDKAYGYNEKAKCCNISGFVGLVIVGVVGFVFLIVISVVAAVLSVALTAPTSSSTASP